MAAATGAVAFSSAVRLGPAGVDQPERAPLKEHAGSRGVLYGAAAQSQALMHDRLYARAFARECAILVPETELKWQWLRPTIETYNFAPADWLANFAIHNNMKFRGHTLVWHDALPKWFDLKVDSKNAKQVLLDHISTVLRRYYGKMHSWDVVNEALLPEDGRDDKLRNTPWLRLLGPSYIETAFHAAAEADPHALLVWNENWLEEETAAGNAKRNAFLGHLRQLLARKVPIHAIGIQSHLVKDRAELAGRNFQNFLRQVGDMGLKILITELDVRDGSPPIAIPIRDRYIGLKYYHYLATVLEEKAVIAVLTWGLSDRYTWISHLQAKTGGRIRALPLDTAFGFSPAWYAMTHAFDEAPRR